MKKILIVNKSFCTGGIQSSMINMANELSTDYEVDIFAFYPEGIMKERLDKRVRVLIPTWQMQALGMAMGDIRKNGNKKIYILRTMYALWAKLFDNRFPLWLSMKFQQKLTAADGTPYDMAISYHHEQKKHTVTAGFARFVDQCVCANKKVAWVHYDPSTLNLDEKFNEKYYKQMDYIVAASKAVEESFRKVHPNLAERVRYCYNFVNREAIVEKAYEQEESPFSENELVCFSATRLAEEKAIPRAISAIAPVLKENKDIKWYIAGDGPMLQQIKDCILENHLEERIILLGRQTNPYYYMAHSDLVMSTSYHEAAPMVYVEAGILNIPVFSTKTLSSVEMLHDKAGDFICENSEDGIRLLFGNIAADRRIIEEAKLLKRSYVINNDASREFIMDLIEGD